MPFLSGVSGALALKRKGPKRFDSNGVEMQQRSDAWNQDAEGRMKSTKENLNSICRITLVVGVAFIITGFVFFLVSESATNVIYLLVGIGIALVTLRVFFYFCFCCKRRSQETSTDRTKVINKDKEPAQEYKAKVTLPTDTEERRASESPIPGSIFAIDCKEEPPTTSILSAKSNKALRHDLAYILETRRASSVKSSRSSIDSNQISPNSPMSNGSYCRDVHEQKH